ncbi:MAG: hypothetical protein IJS31_00395 [Oscillospiraceae bacterium]|nr:hypothetical protein [Oscillospiraceae bacterium]
MQHTENYNLNLFEPGDPVLAENFNENTRKIENELVKRLHSISFEYVGTGERPKVLSFPSKPLFVLLNGAGQYHRNGIAQWNNPYMQVLYCYNDAQMHQQMPISWEKNDAENTWELHISYGRSGGTTDAFNEQGEHFTCTAFLE